MLFNIRPAKVGRGSVGVPGGCSPAIRTKSRFQENQRNAKTRKLSGLVGFLLSSEVQRNAVTLDYLRSKFYINPKSVAKSY